MINLVSTTDNRDPTRLALLVASEHVETNPLYVPGGGLTHCNSFARAVAARMNVPLPDALANVLNGWLKVQAANPATGWEKLDAFTAQRRADAGKLVLGSWFNPIINADGSPAHGHIVVIMPSLGEPGVWSAQAGLVNYTRDHLERGFGAIAPDFFAHP